MVRRHGAADLTFDSVEQSHCLCRTKIEVNMRKTPHTYVYVVTSPGDPYELVKIGVSNDPPSRLNSMRSGSSVKLTLFGAIKCASRADAYRVESEAHRRLKAIRVLGEWFNCCPHQAIQIVTMIRDGVGLEHIAKHVQCQQFYYSSDNDGDERAEELKIELVAAGVWNPTLLDQYIRARDDGRLADFLNVDMPAYRPFLEPSP